MTEFSINWLIWCIANSNKIAPWKGSKLAPPRVGNFQHSMGFLPMRCPRKRIKSIKATCQTMKGWIRFLGSSSEVFGKRRRSDIAHSTWWCLRTYQVCMQDSFQAMLRKDFYEKDVSVYWVQGNLRGKKLSLGHCTHCTHCTDRYASVWHLCIQHFLHFENQLVPVNSWFSILGNF